MWTLALVDWFVETWSWWLTAMVGWSLGFYKGMAISAVSHTKYYDENVEFREGG